MILLLTCTYNRHICLERLLRFYLDQDYKSDSILFIYNNSRIPQSLNEQAIGELPFYKKIILKNNHLDLFTGREYKSVGAIHRDALHLAAEQRLPYVVTFFEDDNYYLPDHISKGIGGMKRAFQNNKCAYKPKYSYFKKGNNISLYENVMEPSIFVEYDFLKQNGFYISSVDFHHKWINALYKENKYFIDEKGKPTLIYVTHNTNLSSTGNNGFGAMLHHRSKHKDIGDGVLTPISKEEAKQYYTI